MTTTDASGATGAPAAGTPTGPAGGAATPPATPALTAEQQAAVLAGAVKAAPDPDANWLKPRLERERKAGAKDVLKEAGFESIEEAKAAAAAAKAAADANKTAAQKASELAIQVASEKARADSLAAIATEHAARMMVGLTAEQQAAVKALAGDDPAKQLATIGALAPTWAKDAKAGGAGGAGGTAEPGATTAPSGGAPSGATPAPTSARAVYEQQRAQNPFAAAQFGAANPQVYTPPK